MVSIQIICGNNVQSGTSSITYDNIPSDPIKGKYNYQRIEHDIGSTNSTSWENLYKLTGISWLYETYIVIPHKIYSMPIMQYQPNGMDTKFGTDIPGICVKES